MAQNPRCFELLKHQVELRDPEIEAGSGTKHIANFRAEKHFR